MLFSIVVGSNYGDEGKGLMTDYLVELTRAEFVARFNGGPQAGHTVVRDGKRHVFGNWGSGTLVRAKTILTQDVVINPFALLKEEEQLANECGIIPPPIYASRRSPITTSYDVAINQAIELRRGKNRHGSCGLGINETITRHLEMQKNSKMSHLLDGADLVDTFNWMRDNYVPRRMEALGFSIDEMKSLLSKHMDYLHGFIDTMSIVQDRILKFRRPLVERPIVYEGAQGLALDEFMGEFPYVTRSNTGIKNALDHIVQIADPISTHAVMAVYTTRTYLTRHGAGNLDYEMSTEELLGKEFNDTTNVTNPWQENFRYAPLNIPQLIERIRNDIKRNEPAIKDYGFEFRPVVAVTCFDHSLKPLVIKDEKEGPVRMLNAQIAMEIERQAGDFEVAWISHGPTARDIDPIHTPMFKGEL